MAMVDFKFDTQKEAEAFAEAIDYVNDSYVTVQSITKFSSGEKEHIIVRLEDLDTSFNKMIKHDIQWQVVVLRQNTCS